MNRLHCTSPAELNPLARITNTVNPGAKCANRATSRLPMAASAPLSFRTAALSAPRLHVGLAAALLLTSSLLLAHPANAQLRGDWPTDIHLTRVSDANASQANHFSVRDSDNRVSVPRGDLRKDVADAARMDSRRPAR